MSTNENLPEEALAQSVLIWAADVPEHGLSKQMESLELVKTAYLSTEYADDRKSRNEVLFHLSLLKNLFDILSSHDEQTCLDLQKLTVLLRANVQKRS